MLAMTMLGTTTNTNTKTKQSQNLAQFSPKLERYDESFRNFERKYENIHESEKFWYILELWKWLWYTKKNNIHTNSSNYIIRHL